MSDLKKVPPEIINITRKSMKALKNKSNRSILDLDLPEFTKDMSTSDFWKIIEQHLNLRGFKIIEH